MVNHSLKGLDLFSQSERRYHKKNVIPKMATKWLKSDNGFRVLSIIPEDHVLAKF